MTTEGFDKSRRMLNETKKNMEYLCNNFTKDLTYFVENLSVIDTQPLEERIEKTKETQGKVDEMFEKMDNFFSLMSEVEKRMWEENHTPTPE